MDKKTISEAVAPELEKMGCFLVDVTVSKANDIEVVIEKESGTVDMDDCAALDRFFHGVFSQDEEDYSLTVSSAGLDRPFKVLRQYEKAVGSRVTASFRGGRRVLATIEAVTPEELTLSVGGVSETVPFSSITTVIPYIEFK
ncbi:MAG: hypothetical protein J6T02_03180 [Bacteroidales bacterium]|nr:hypothetical protein [Bacteroidales bacterium]